MFAGHETTASTLSATLAFLAANPAEQAIVHDEIDQLIKLSGTETFSFDQYDSLPKVRAAFVEALRMIPAGSILIRKTGEDTVLRVTVPLPEPSNSNSCVSDKENGGYVEKSVPIPKGVTMIGDMIGIRKYTSLLPSTLAGLWLFLMTFLIYG